MNKVKLGQAVDILDYKRIPVSSAERANREKVYPYYGAQGVVDYIDDYIFDGEYVLVAEDGNNLKTLSEPIVTWATGRFWVNNHAHIIGGNGTADIRYVYYYLMASDLRGLITGSAQPKLNQENLASFELELPGREAQVKIAEVLRSIDDKIALNKKIMTELEDTARLIYDYWFTQFDFPDENGKPYRSSGGKMVYDETLNREIPEGWEVTKIGKQCELRLGGTPDTSVREFWGGGMPWLNSAEVAVSPILRAEKNITKAGVENSATSFAPAGSVLLSITRYIRPSILAIDACFNQSVVAILENRTLHTEFLYPFVQSQVPRYLTLRTGAQQPHINKVTVSETCFSMPTELILARYYDKVAPIFNQLILVAKAVDRLSALRDWLLPMLVNGQVHVD
ncbi:restriction endonuclease subunit S [Adlercreutzia caecimuris]|uniref:Type I restriction modification DNA specificity domain-containing protein n=1 Tax=Adlercreutzia caecimuris B7 TaxID=1235794 RepID=R9KUX7_9ACTN|nr:restriction endonuclease subunit S [Adlercreutzia caecimuris]EOS50180.1 hypothetical protein C811_01803 [Adlercreutzia caecimuris B7]